MRRFLLLCVVNSLFISLTSCQVRGPNYRTPAQLTNHSIEQGISKNAVIEKNKVEAQLPNSIKNFLIPDVSDKKSSFTKSYNKRFDVNVTNIDAATFFRNLAKETPYNIVVDPKVTGNVTVNLKNVTIPEILGSLKDLYGYEYTPTSFGFEVMPPKLESRIFHVDYIDMTRNTRSYTSMGANEVGAPITTGDVTNNGIGYGYGYGGSTSYYGGATTNTQNNQNNMTGNSRSMVNTTSEVNFWSELTSTLKSLIGTENGRSIVVNPGSGTVVVKAYPNEVREVSSFLEKIQSSMAREVILEVKILEVTLNDEYQAGINWTILGFSQDAKRLGIPPDSSTFATFNIHSSGGSEANIQSVIKLLEEQGNVQTLSNPRVLTINNQQALIKVGEEKYFVTGITSNINNNVTTNTGGVVTTASVNLTPFFSGIILDVTPQISANGEVLLHIHPIISDVKQDNQSINIGASQPLDLPLADNAIREYDSIVRSRNGELVLIGGLMENDLSEVINATPGASKVPFMGALFRATNQTARKREIVILLKPTLIGQDKQEISQQLPVTQERIAQLDRPFHAGSLPEVFGNEAELPSHND